MKLSIKAMFQQSGPLDQKIRLKWGEGKFELGKESPLCRAIYMVAMDQEKEIAILRARVPR